jgi:hypothetical protein
MVSKLATFQSQFGHLDVPKDYKPWGLGEWLQEKKKQGKEGTIKPLHADRLLRVGFQWEEDMESWLAMYERVNEVVEECRQDSKKSLELTEDLDDWAKVQFMLMEYELLKPMRKKKFESLSLAIEKCKVVFKKSPEEEQYQLKIETTPEQGRWIGMSLKSAALNWNPFGPTTEIVGSDDTDYYPNPKREFSLSDGLASSNACESSSKKRKTVKSS